MEVLELRACYKLQHCQEVHSGTKDWRDQNHNAARRVRVQMGVFFLSSFHILFLRRRLEKVNNETQPLNELDDRKDFQNLPFFLKIVDYYS